MEAEEANGQRAVLPVNLRAGWLLPCSLHSLNLWWVSPLQVFNSFLFFGITYNCQREQPADPHFAIPTWALKLLSLHPVSPWKLPAWWE